MNPASVAAPSPAVSIGLPVYNGARFLQEALDALLGQTWQDLELIISDNCSTDATREICERAAARDPRVRYMRQPENIGPTRNFAFVLQQARGEFFMWAAHDDRWDSGWIEALVARLRAGAALAFGEVVQVDEHNRLLRTCPRFTFQGPRLWRKLRFLFSEEWNGKANLLYGLMRTRDVRQLGLQVYSRNPFGADMHFVYRVLQLGDAASAPGVRLYKRFVASDLRPPAGSWLRRALLADRLPYYAVYPRIATDAAEQLTIVICLPIAYVKALAVSVLRRLRRGS
jgi:glycosyltransferase involved in cell wall biosynthesis